MLQKPNIFSHMINSFMKNAHREMEKTLNFKINYSINELKKIENYIDKYYPNNQPLEYESIVSLGIYFGHILEKNTKEAKWNISVENLYSIHLEITNNKNEKIEVYPFQRVFGYSINKELTLTSCYQDVMKFLE